MSILIVGGAGYIGSHANKLLARAGYDTIVLDDLSRGHRELVRYGTFIQGDLGDPDLLAHIFKTHTIRAVMHFAAFAYVGESVHKPDIYYRNNVVKTLALLDAMVKHGVGSFIFSSTCATFGVAKQVPLDENHPQEPINPYGNTKLVVEHILRDYDKAFGLKHCIFRYFNAAGADPDAEIGEKHDPETHLIPLVLDAADGRGEIEIFGTDYPTPDGTCIRDYIHVCDLAEAHRLGMERLLETRQSDHFNLGCGKGYSIREVINTAEKVCGKSIPVRFAPRREGDPPILVGSSEKAARTLGWTPKFSLEDSIATAWKWYQASANDKQPNGF